MLKEEVVRPAPVPSKEEPAPAPVPESKPATSSPSSPPPDDENSLKKHEPHLGPRPRSHNRVLNPPGGKSSVMFYWSAEHATPPCFVSIHSLSDTPLIFSHSFTLLLTVVSPVHLNTPGILFPWSNMFSPTSCTFFPISCSLFKLCCSSLKPAIVQSPTSELLFTWTVSILRFHFSLFEQVSMKFGLYVNL